MDCRVKPGNDEEKGTPRGGSSVAEEIAECPI